MGFFNLRVWRSGHGCFPVLVSRLPIEAVELTGFIELSPTGIKLGLTADDWDVY